MWFHSKENSEDSARCWGSPGGTQPTQPCQHHGHFPNPLSQELPCSPPPDPSALREYNSSPHAKILPLALGLGALPPPSKIEPKATCPSRTLAWLLPARPGGCHGVMLGQGNTSTSPTLTPSLLFQCQEQYAVRADLRPGQGHLLLAAPDVPSPSPTRAQRGAALAPLHALADPLGAVRGHCWTPGRNTKNLGAYKRVPRGRAHHHHAGEQPGSCWHTRGPQSRPGSWG